MDLLDESGLTPGWLIASVPPHRLVASFLVKGTFVLKHQGVAELAPKQDDLEGDVPEEENPTALRYTRDLTPVKPFVDLLLSGTAYAPEGKPVSMLPVTFRVGSWSKMLAVLGDRVVTGAAPFSKTTEPVSFSEMPLTWSRSWGGRSCAKNPAGRGLDEERDKENRRFFRAPNALRVDEAGLPPEDLREPASFAPVSPDWPQRMSLAKKGDFGPGWLKGPWPAPPADFDWSFFNAAPPDQRLSPGSLRGDETIEFHNLHPAHLHYVGRLPGVRPRFFVVESVPKEEFREVPLRIDTVWADPTREKLVLVWRGLSPIRTKGMKEISAIVIARESMDQKALPAEHYRERLRRKRVEREARENVPPPPPIVIEPLQVAKPDFDWDAWEKRLDQEMKTGLQEMDRASKESAQATRAAAETALKEQGIPTGILNHPQPQDPAILASQAAKAHADLARLSPAAGSFLRPPPTAADFDVEAKVKAAFDDFHKDFAKPVLPESGPEAPPKIGPKTPEEIEAESPWTRERVVRHAASKRPFVRQDLRGLDLSGLQLREQRFEECVLAKTDLHGADLSASVFLRCSLPEANLEGARLVRSAVTFCDLAKARFAEAGLAGTVFDHSDCSEAVFDKAKLDHVSARRATFNKAAFEAGEFLECDFTQADFNGAALAGVSLGRSVFRGANAYGLKAAGSDFDGCDLTNFRAGDGADFTGARFRGITAPSSVWEGVVLDRADFSRADLREASFASASLVEASFVAANLCRARLPEANLRKARLARSNLFRGTLEGADLTGSDLRGTNLYEAEFLDAVRDGALLDGANVKGTKLG